MNAFIFLVWGKFNSAWCQTVNYVYEHQNIKRNIEEQSEKGLNVYIRKEGVRLVSLSPLYMYFMYEMLKSMFRKVIMLYIYVHS